MTRSLTFALATGVGLIAAGPVFADVSGQEAVPAQAQSQPPVQASAVGTPAPSDASTSQLRPLCTDRPTKSTSPCTVDPGRLQIEADLYNVTFDHSGGSDTTTSLNVNPTLKWGVGKTTDVEVSIAPFETVTARKRATSITMRDSGIGDLFGRVKFELVGGDGGDVGFGLVPYIKLPTAPAGVGNGAVEVGLVAPIALNLQAGWSLVIDPEVDDLKNAIGEGRHANYSGLLSVSYLLTQTVTLSAELWGDVNDDPSDQILQASVDIGAAWIPTVSPNLQWDGGVNFGLNSQTPVAQVYVGVSRRF